MRRREKAVLVFFSVEFFTDARKRCFRRTERNVRVTVIVLYAKRAEFFAESVEVALLYGR